MRNLSYDQDGNSGFVIQSETNNQVAVVWTDTEDEEEIKELEKLTKLFVSASELLEALEHTLEILYECDCPSNLLETYSNAIANYGNLVRETKS